VQASRSKRPKRRRYESDSECSWSEQDEQCGASQDEWHDDEAKHSERNLDTASQPCPGVVEATLGAGGDTSGGQDVPPPVCQIVITEDWQARDIVDVPLTHELQGYSPLVSLGLGLGRDGTISVPLACQAEHTAAPPPAGPATAQQHTSLPEDCFPACSPTTLYTPNASPLRLALTIEAAQLCHLVGAGPGDMHATLSHVARLAASPQ
jgi:hypothetical protein